VDYLQNMSFYYYLAGGSACLIVLAVILYFVPGGRIKIPAIVFCALACLLAGVGVGVIGMYRFGYHWEREPQKLNRAPFGGPGGGPGGGGGGGEGKRGGGGGGGKKGEGNKGSGAEAKNGSEKKSGNVDD